MLTFVVRSRHNVNHAISIFVAGRRRRALAKAYPLSALRRRSRLWAFYGRRLSQLDRPSEGECDATGVAYPKVSDVESADLLKLAGKCLDANKAEYVKVLCEHFGRVPPDYPNALLYLAKSPFKSYVTTNFDPLLRRALEDQIDSTLPVYKFPTCPSTELNGRALFHIHGAIEEGVPPDPEGIVLTAVNFERAYAPEKNLLWSFLQQLFTYEQCCFVGCGLTEPPIRRLLEVCLRFRRIFAETDSREEPREHFALLPAVSPRISDLAEQDSLDKRRSEAERRMESESEYLAGIGITVVRYGTDDSTAHWGLREFLRTCGEYGSSEFLTYPPTGDSL